MRSAHPESDGELKTPGRAKQLEAMGISSESGAKPATIRPPTWGVSNLSAELFRGSVEQHTLGIQNP